MQTPNDLGREWLNRDPDPQFGWTLTTVVILAAFLGIMLLVWPQ